MSDHGAMFVVEGGAHLLRINWNKNDTNIEILNCQIVLVGSVEASVELATGRLIVNGFFFFFFFFFNTIFVLSHMYPENPQGTQVIVGSMNMGYISDTARNRTHNLFRPKREPIPLCHSDGLFNWSALESRNGS